MHKIFEKKIEESIIICFIWNVNIIESNCALFRSCLRYGIQKQHEFNVDRYFSTWKVFYDSKFTHRISN